MHEIQLALHLLAQIALAKPFTQVQTSEKFKSFPPCEEIQARIEQGLAQAEKVSPELWFIQG